MKWKPSIERVPVCRSSSWPPRSTSTSTGRSSGPPSTARRLLCCWMHAKRASRVSTPLSVPFFPSSLFLPPNCHVCLNHSPRSFSTVTGTGAMCHAQGLYVTVLGVRARQGAHSRGPPPEPKTLIYCWPSVVVCPDAPVFHAQPVSDPQSQYGANVSPRTMFPEVRPLSYSD